jgi:hypothetical protein
MTKPNNLTSKLGSTAAALILASTLAMPTVALAEANDTSGDTSSNTSSILELNDSTTSSSSSSASSNPKSSLNNSSVFSFSGTGTTVDDSADSDNIEFLTITTDHNNVFYLVIDRTSTSENTYLLVQADEDDISSLAKSTTGVIDTSALQSAISGSSSSSTSSSNNSSSSASSTTSASNTTETAATTTDTQNEIPSSILIVVATLLAAGAAFGYYKLKVQPEREENKTENDKRVEELHGISKKSNSYKIPIETDFDDEEDNEKEYVGSVAIDHSNAPTIKNTNTTQQLPSAPSTSPSPSKSTSKSSK